MSKEKFLKILSRQQHSGFTLKDFCVNEVYTESSFYYWKGKFGLSRPYHVGSSSSEGFTPVNLTSPPSSNQAYDRVAMGSGEIQIEFLGGLIARFSGIAESYLAMQLLTQICDHHVLPE